MRQKGRINITTKSILLIIIILIKWNMVHKAAQQNNNNIVFINKLIRAFYVKKSWHMKKVGCVLYFFKLRVFNK